MQPKKGDSSRKQSTRLPVIAPKDDLSSSASSTRSTTLGISNVPVPSRARLPPRSRTGCWTCRTRKVKCDEGRPNCGQCSRLGHKCDYSPRLSFRDDTPRVVERMQEISTVGNSVWDPNSPAADSSTSQSVVEAEDGLPPFTVLTTDEEREQKAERASPGTFHVVVNPESFSHLPEYSDDSVDGASTHISNLRRGSLASSIGKARSDGVPFQAESPDPTTVILSRFEDSMRRTNTGKGKQTSTSPILTHTPFPSAFHAVNIPDGAADGMQDGMPDGVPDGMHDGMQDGMPGGMHDGISDGMPHGLPDGLSGGLAGFDNPQSLINIAAAGGQDSGLLNHFRTKIWGQTMQIDVIRKDSMNQAHGWDLFESEAALFPPLFHAMMALSALSLANRDGVQRLDALQHYQQALPSLQNNLRNDQDISSDGTFLTHFLLLLYEIAAAEPGVSNLWSNHLAQLLRITTMRRHIYGSERYPFIIWLVCHIDIHAVFSGSGTGEFFDTMLENDMLPPPSFQLYPLGMDGSSVISPEEADSLPTILQLNYDITVLAARLGQLGRELRREAVAQLFPNESVQNRTDTKMRQRRTFELQEAFRQLWQAPAVVLIDQAVETLSPRSLEIYQQASSMTRACIIYSHTSMWPSQRIDTGPESDDEISLCASAILKTAEDITNAGNLQLRFIVFPLFMAGVASSSGSDKMLALDLMTIMEKEGVGRNTTTTRHILQIVYERQTQRFMSQGHSLDVDWMDIMIEQGLQVVNFGI